MKITIAILLLLVFMPVGLAQAQNLPSAGITPDSFLYGLDKTFEKLGNSLAGKTGKIDKRLSRASERLAELAKMIGKGNAAYNSELLSSYQEELQNAEDAVLEAKDAGANVDVVEKKMAVATFNHVLVLESVLDSAPSAAQDGLRNAIQMSTKGNQRALSRLERSTGKAAGISEDLALRRKKQ